MEYVQRGKKRYCHYNYNLAFTNATFLCQQCQASYTSPSVPHLQYPRQSNLVKRICFTSTNCQSVSVVIMLELALVQKEQ
jgi:hypothetical protein